MNRNRKTRSILICVLVATGILLIVDRNSKADFTFGEPKNLGPTINSSSGDIPDCFSSDGLEMYLHSYNRPGGYGGWDIWVSTKQMSEQTSEDYWSEPQNLGPPVNTGRTEDGASISDDGLDLYFDSYNRSGGYGGWDIWITRRATKDDPWGEPVNLGPVVNSSSIEACPWISSDELELYFCAVNRTGGYGDADIWVTRRVTKDDPWGEPTNLGPMVNSSACEAFPSLSSDGLLLFFSEEINTTLRPGGYGNVDIWVTRRTSVSGPWDTPVNIGSVVNSPNLDGIPRISPDGSMLYFCSERPGGLGGTYGDIYQAHIIPIVDLNSDGIVDADDMCIMVDNWGTNNSLCDIGPMPWGNGIVDVEDLIVLAKHLFEEIPPADPNI